MQQKTRIANMGTSFVKNLKGVLKTSTNKVEMHPLYLIESSSNTIYGCRSVAR